MLWNANRQKGKIDMKTVEAHGVTIPALGLGTWELRGQQCAELVKAALDMGYRHVDTAQMYANEREVGEGIRASGVARSEVFLTTKIWPDCHAADDFARAVDERLELLDCGPVDLLLLHWPSRTVPFSETISALNKARRAGLCRHIGISNFTVAQIREAVAISDAPLLCNQVEFHPLINQDKVHAACREAGMVMTAYCPIARNRVADEPVMQEIATEHGVSPADITLAWHMAHGDVIAIPRSSQPERLASNLASSEIKLSDDEFSRISALKAKHVRVCEPESVAPVWDQP
jgi:diketogulonate reductase-like aldo/keto reductase